MLHSPSSLVGIDGVAIAGVKTSIVTVLGLVDTVWTAADDLNTSPVALVLLTVAQALVTAGRSSVDILRIAVGAAQPARVCGGGKRKGGDSDEGSEHLDCR